MKKGFFFGGKQKLWKNPSIARKSDSQLVTMNIFCFCVAYVLLVNTNAWFTFDQNYELLGWYDIFYFLFYF